MDKAGSMLLGSGSGVGGGLVAVVDRMSEAVRRAIEWEHVLWVSSCDWRPLLELCLMDLAQRMWPFWDLEAVHGC